MIKTYIATLLLALVSTQTMMPPTDGYFFYSDFYLQFSKGYHSITVQKADGT
jgi:hypothetical protein